MPGCTILKLIEIYLYSGVMKMGGAQIYGFGEHPTCLFITTRNYYGITNSILLAILINQAVYFNISANYKTQLVFTVVIKVHNVTRSRQRKKEMFKLRGTKKTSGKKKDPERETG